MENSNGGNTNVGSIGNSIKNERSSIEKDIHLLESYAGMTHKMTDNQGRPKLDQAIERVLLDYKRVLKENERYKKSDYETICLENNELREITDRIQSEYNDLLKDNFKLKNELETKRKEYQETYKDVREELRELRKENEELKNQEETARKVNELLVERYSTSIPIQKVKEKIEEFKEEINQLRIERNVTYDSGIYRNQIKIDILQELLESEE